MDQVRDVVIIGGGPVGLYGAYLAGLHRLRTTIIERLPELGGQPRFLYPEKPIYDIGGYPRIDGQLLAVQLSAQALQYPVEVRIGDEASKLQPLPGPRGPLWQVTTRSEVLTTATVIVACGIGKFLPRRMDNPAIDRYEDNGLYYVVGPLREFADRRVLVVGGGDSAADWAMAIAPRCQALTLIHRRQVFHCHADSLYKLTHDPKVRMLTESQLVELHGTDRVEAATVLTGPDRERRVIEVEAVVVAIGLVPDLGPLQAWDLGFSGELLPVDTRMATRLPGVFGAGDVVTYPGKVKLIATGFGEIATAIESARARLAEVGVSGGS